MKQQSALSKMFLQLPSVDMSELDIEMDEEMPDLSDLSFGGFKGHK